MVRDLINDYLNTLDISLEDSEKEKLIELLSDELPNLIKSLTEQI